MHFHSTSCSCKQYSNALASSQDLLSTIIKGSVRGINVVDIQSPRLLFREFQLRNQPSQATLSDSDNQLILVIPFDSVVKIKAILLKGEALPSSMRTFKNEQKVDFGFCSESQALQELIVDSSAQECGLLLKASKYQNVQTLVIYLSGPQQISLSYLQIKGQNTHIQRKIVQCLYQLRPTAAKSPSLFDTVNTAVQ